MMKAALAPSAIDYNRGLHGAVVATLGRSIVGGQLGPGEPIGNEAEIGVQLGVSRSVVREAVRVLAAKRLVLPKPKAGTRVRPREEWNVLDPDVISWMMAEGPSKSVLQSILEVRIIIEPSAALLAATRASAQDLRDLDHCYQAMVQASAGSAERIEADLKLHRAIVSAAHNEFLSRLSETLQPSIRTSQLVSSRVPSDEIPRHRAVVDAILARDPERAEAAMRELLAGVAEDLDAATSTPAAAVMSGP